ncbi:MAG: serine--tRNA ligase [Pseudomonadota bacterium]
MLDLKFVRNNLDKIQEMLRLRRSDLSMSGFAALDARRRDLLAQTEALKHQRNVASAAIGAARKRGETAAEAMAEMREVGERISALDGELAQIETEMQSLLLLVPNLPDPDVPEGKDSSDNPVLRHWGTPPEFGFEPLNHWDIGERLGILDFTRGAKLAGSRFTVYKGAGARLERALINFMLDLHTQKSHGYIEVLPPFIVNEQSMTATGQLPKFKEDLFKLEGWDYYLIPTAEVPVTNLHRDETLAEGILPLKYCSYTPCFRAEAGSHGKDARGLIRQHQFNKVELVKFTRPEESLREMEALLADAEEVLRILGLPYRVIALCTGDLGFASAKTYDIEVWMPGQRMYREISSCSTFTDFQARRANIRFKREGKKGTELVHTINGSGLAVGRTLAALLENCQQADGTVLIPEALRPYMDGRNSVAS